MIWSFMSIKKPRSANQQLEEEHLLIYKNPPSAIRTRPFSTFSISPVISTSTRVHTIKFVHYVYFCIGTRYRIAKYHQIPTSYLKTYDFYVATPWTITPQKGGIRPGWCILEEMSIKKGISGSVKGVLIGQYISFVFLK